MGQVTVTYGTTYFQLWREYEFIKLRTFLMGYFLHLRGILRYIWEKSKQNTKMKSTAVWDMFVWDKFFDHFNNFIKHKNITTINICESENHNLYSSQK